MLYLYIYIYIYKHNVLLIAVVVVLRFAFIVVRSFTPCLVKMLGCILYICIIYIYMQRCLRRMACLCPT